jgi:hypothetical protein
VSQQHAQKDVPVALADTHPLVSKLHFPTTVIDRSARAPADVIDQKLQFALYAVSTAMSPEIGLVENPFEAASW